MREKGHLQPANEQSLDVEHLISSYHYSIRADTVSDKHPKATLEIQLAQLLIFIILRFYLVPAITA